jgi:cellulose synthase/poly-beta-1,6-N-acetylglucosamine synthase-like glycosyltransferase
LIFFQILFVLTVILLAVYGYYALIIAWYRFRRHKPIAPIEPAPDIVWPSVTVQLPLYNERYVVERLIHAVAALDYPRDRLQIQVLDDSTDCTQEIVERVLEELSGVGIDLENVHRTERKGYKGGALANGLSSAWGEYIAIFDADFLPQPEFLKQSIPHLMADPEIGCIQTRWGHLNREHSWLTRAQAAGIDGHFYIEQESRSETALFMNFNGTAGVWRKSCIEQAGGWQSDTLTEDLDLSYRAQLTGWRIQYLPHVITPGELPSGINALKRQQFRWAKGSIQTARKLLGPLWRSEQPLYVKVSGSIHLTNYMVQPLMLLNLFLAFPIIQIRSPIIWFIPLITAAAAGPLLMYWLALGEQGKLFKERVPNLFMLVILGTGLSFNNTRGVIEALLGIESGFKRTPKLNLLDGKQNDAGDVYRIKKDAGFWAELLFALYPAGLLIFILSHQLWGPVVWLFLYATGFGYVTVLNFR